MKKLLYIVLDGLGDRPVKALGGKTPLEAAETPLMDKLAKNANMGFVYTVGKNIAPESDVAVISILGYDPNKYYSGRGPLESYAENIDINEGDLAFRVNFATREPDTRKIIDRRVGRNLSTEEATLLAKEVNSKVKLTGADFIFKNTIGHRGVLVIRKKKGKLSAEITNTDPAYDKEGVYGVAKETFKNIIQISEPTEKFKDSPEARTAANLTNEFVDKSSSVLESSDINKKRKEKGEMPANLILTRDSGDRLPTFPKIQELYHLNIGCFVEMPVEKGIALLTGMNIVNVPLPTKDLKKDYTLRAEKVVEALGAFDALYIHIKGPDEPAHDGDYEHKKESIEAIDKYFFGQLLPNIDIDNTIITVTADHSTPCELKAHSDDPVPLMISGTGFRSDGLEAFSERNSKKGSLGALQGHELMNLFIRYIK